jgi:hypothetical protein
LFFFFLRLLSQHDEDSCQRDIDRLMKKLEEPSKTQTPIEETQPEEVFGPILISQTGTTHQQTTTPTSIIQSEKSQHQQSNETQPTTITQTDEIGIQTDNSQNSSIIHNCCHDVSICPCVLVS